MSGFVCPNCGVKIDIFRSGGGKRIAEEMNIPFLGSIPIDQKISESSDKGIPFIIEHKESSVSKTFMEIVQKIKEVLGYNETKKTKNNVEKLLSEGPEY